MTAGATEAIRQENSIGFLYSRSFDLFFIFGTTLLAAVCGVAALYNPVLLYWIFGINLWTLAYHHVIATFTRLCFDPQSHRRALLLLYALFPAVMGVIVTLAQTQGMWIIATLYLYGQWFHYARQSWGISRAYERNAPQGYSADRSWQTQAAFYSFPIWGILYRSYQQPDVFLTLSVKTFPVPFELVAVAGAFSLLFFGLWLLRVYGDWRRGVLPVAYTWFMLSHFFVFFFAYIVMPTIDSGWLVTNIWHNLQYIMFVWMFNNRSYRAGIDPKAKFLSMLSQRQNVVAYFAVMLLITSIVYISIKSLIPLFGFGVLILFYMTINFHHYIVDAIIWRAAWIKRGRQQAAAP